MTTYQVLTGDAFTQLRTLPDASVQCWLNLGDSYASDDKWAARRVQAKRKEEL